MGSAYFDTAVTGTQTVPFGVTAAGGNLLIPVHTSVRATANVAPVALEISIGSQGVASPAEYDKWGIWGILDTDLPRIIHGVVVSDNKCVQIPLPILPHGLGAFCKSTFVAGTTLRGTMLYLEGPAELVGPEFFRPVFGNFTWSSAI
jgi:hypothetical protein